MMAKKNIPNYLYRALLIALSIISAQQKVTAQRPSVDLDRPHIFNHSETVNGGELLGLQGAGFGDSPELWFSIVDSHKRNIGPERSLTIVSHSDRNISALLPEGAAIKSGALVAVWVKRGTVLSSPIFLNRARAVTLEFDQLMPGQRFRIFGRNLHAPGAKSSVRLVDELTNKILSAKVLQFDAYTLQAEAPDLITGRRYKLLVNNGAGAAFGETEAEERIYGAAKAVDPFGLQVVWGTAFDFAGNSYNVKTDPRLSVKARGDGKFNDRGAIQQAIDMAAKSGGGVVYLPAGTYRLDIPSGSGLTMRSRVVLKGQGLDKTFLQYGFGTPPPYVHPIGKTGWPDETTEGVAILWPLNTTLTGLYGLCLQNVNGSGVWRHSLKNMPPSVKKPGAGGSKFFVSHCRFDFAVSWGLSWGHVDRFAITDCIFDSKAQVTWPWLWHCNGATNFIVRNNRIHYAAGRFGFNDSANGIIEHNHISRLGDLQNPGGETGGFNIDYAADIVVLDNRLDVEGRTIENHNQGETILSQGGNPDQMAIGKVSSADPGSITDTSQQWGTIKTPSLSSSDAVAIIEGKGTGQWRRIKSNNAHTVFVDRPWDVVPDKSSHYSIMRWSAEDWLVKDNILEGNNRGIWFYCGANDLVITGNQLNNSEGIYLRSDQRLVMGRYNLMWNALVADNKVTNTDGLRPAFVCNVLALGTRPDSLFGVGSIGVEIRRNLVRASRPNAATFVRGEGYFNEVLLKNPTYATKALQGNITGVIGTLFEHNVAENADIGYRLYQAIDQTVIKDARYKNVKEPFTAAKGTVLLSGNQIIPVPPHR